MIQSTLKQEIIDILVKAVGLMGEVENRPEMKIEYARDEKFGDYACTIAMDKQWRDAYSTINPEFKNPRKFADELRRILLETDELSGSFASVEVAGPGFLNLTVSDSLLRNFVIHALQDPGSYGRSQSEDPRKIIFEYVSANPTGPLNVVSARAAALGDSCSNLLEAAGHKVHREYYVNDYGNQVRLLGISCLYRFLESEGALLKFSRKDEKGEAIYEKGPGIPFPAEGYHGEYLTDIAKSVVEKNPELKVDKKQLDTIMVASRKEEVSVVFYEEQNLEELASGFGKAATDFFLSTHQRDLDRFRVHFDQFYRESGLHESMAVTGVLDSLRDYLYVQDGKTFFRSTDFGDDKDRVVLRDDGRPTYLLADIAYHKQKMDRGFDRIWNIWGPDHHGYIKRLAGALTAMGYPESSFQVYLAQQVNLLDGGKQVVMSKRTGKFITMETLMEEIPVDVSRYFFVMRSFDAHLDFDLAEAADTSDRNPYYYVAYAHARIRSIFQKASELSFSELSAHDMRDLKALPLTPERRKLLWLVARYPEEVRDAAEALEPHRLITFLYQVAQALSRFYGVKENKIIDQKADMAAYLLSLLHSVAICLKNGLNLLGMEAPERMVRENEASD